MHVVATNICVWVRTLVREYLNEITVYYTKKAPNITAAITSTTMAPLAGKPYEYSVFVNVSLVR